MVPKRLLLSVASLPAFAATAAAAAPDLIPIRQGIYVPAASACKGASRAAMVNYWGGNSSIGNGMATCTIRKMIARKGNSYTFTDICTDIISGDKIEGGPITLTVLGPAAFRMETGGEATAYKYCGPRPQ